jgi:hypothetical protein
MSVRTLSAAALAFLALAWAWVQVERRTNTRGVPDEVGRSSASPVAAEIRAATVERDPEPADGPGNASVPEPLDSARNSVRAAPENSLIGCVLYGRVLSSGSAPGWTPTVALTDDKGTRRQTKASDDGHYSLAGLAPGPWTLTWRATGFRSGEEELELEESTPIVKHDLVLQRSPLLNVRVVTPEGETLAVVRKERWKAKLPELLTPFAIATLEAPGATVAIEDAYEHFGVGQFWTSGPLWEAAGPDFAGVLELKAEPPLFVSLVLGTRVLATQSVVAGAEEVTFVVTPEQLLAQQAQVSLHAVDADTGEPLPGEVSIDSREIHNVRDGTWSHTMPPGRYQLGFSARGHAVVPFDLTLAPGETRDLGELRVPRELTIEGHLLDADGKPVAGRLRIGVRDERGKLRFRQDMYSDLITDQDGFYKAWGLVPGRYVLLVTDEDVFNPGRDDPPTVWVSGNVDVSTLGGSVTNFDLHLVKAGILVLKGTSTMPSDWQCKILDEHGELLRWTGFYEGFVPRFALPPGPCTLIVCDESWGEHDRHPLVIQPGTNELDLTR